jgi:hypothetical protein
MTDTIIGERAPIPKADQWADRIAAQQRSGVAVRQFCKEQGLTEYSFYPWLKRLQKKEPIRFALVDRGATRQEPATEAALELVMATGERLRIGAGVDAATLRTVLEVCGRDPSASQRAGVSLPDSMRMRKSFDGLHALVREHLEFGCFRRTLVCLRQPSERSDQDPVLGPRRLRDVEQLTVFTLHLFQFQADILKPCLQTCRSIH